MFVAILINILIVFIVIFAPALVKVLKLNESGRDFIENIDEPKKGYFSIVASDISRERPSYSKDIDKILNPAGVNDFSIYNFFDSLH